MPLSFGRDPNAPGVLLSQLPELLLSCRMLMKLLTSVPSTVNVAVVAVAGSAAAAAAASREGVHKLAQGFEMLQGLLFQCLECWGGKASSGKGPLC